MTRLDLALAALLALALIIAGALTALDKTPPDLVDLVAAACLGGLGVRTHAHVGGRRRATDEGKPDA